MPQTRNSSGIISSVHVLVFLASSAYSQSSGANRVRIDILNHKEGAATFMVDGKSARGSLLDVLRLGRPNGTTILNVLFHSDPTLKDIEEVRATAAKQGGYAETHTFFSCRNLNRPAWCELTIGKPIAEPK
jgi:hypothetical protein